MRVGGVAVGACAGAAAGFREGELNEKAEEADGVSEGGLEAKEKLEDAEPKGPEPPRESVGGAEVVE